MAKKLNPFEKAAREVERQVGTPNKDKQEKSEVWFEPKKDKK